MISKEDTLKWIPAYCDADSEGIENEEPLYSKSDVLNAMDVHAAQYEDKYKEANQFICDLGKMLGQDGLGYDDLKWTIEDFRDAIDEKKKEICLELLEYMANHGIRISFNVREEPIFEYKGQWISKEELFENFL